MAELPDDAEQLRYDLEDALARLERVRRALEAEEELGRRVKELEKQLLHARRQLKEARWEVASATHRIRTGRTPVIRDGRPVNPGGE